MAGAGEQDRETAGTAAEIDDIGRGRRQQPAHQRGPRGVDRRIPQPVVGLLVERGGLVVPERPDVVGHPPRTVRHDRRVIRRITA